MSWLFLCLWLSTEISCFLHTLAKLVAKTKSPKFGSKFIAFCSAYDRARSFSAIALMSEIAGISGTILVFERPLIIKKAVS